MEKMKSTGKNGNRLLSLDALRGFNMFWIIGADQIAAALAKLDFPGAALVADQLNHTSWKGFSFYDLIYPMFIFVVGVSTTLAIEHRREKGASTFAILRHILIRTVLLFLVGLYLSNSGLDWNGWLTNVRLMGVLQRIALCYAGAALLVLFTKVHTQAVITGLLLCGYYLLLKLAPVPGYGTGSWTPQGNFANYFDSLFLPGRLYYQTWDVEGLLSTLPALATCLFGVFTGYWLKNEWRFKGKPVTPEQKTLLLGAGGAVLVGLGFLWGLDFPIIKKIWTSSYAILTAGLSAITMALFYWLIDIRGYRKWAFPFAVIGLNSIFVYLIVNLVPFENIAGWLSGEQLLTRLGTARDLYLTMVSLIIEWLLLLVMYWRKIFIKL